MSDQGNRLMFFLIQLMFPDSQAKKIVGEIFFYLRNFMPTFFFPIR